MESDTCLPVIQSDFDGFNLCSGLDAPDDSLRRPSIDTGYARSYAASRKKTEDADEQKLAKQPELELFVMVYVARRDFDGR